jgi:anti-sigma factor (TIGR02949 family)
MNCRTADELFTAYVDGELGTDTETSLAAHLEVCNTCRLEVEVEESVKRMVSDRLQHIPAPVGLKSRVCAALAEEEEHRPWWHEISRRVRRHPRQIVGALAALFLVAAVGILSTVLEPEPPALAARLMRHHADCAVQFATDNPLTVKSWFQSQGIDVADTPSSLAPFDYSLIGAHICEMLHQNAAYMVYRHQGKEVSICRVDGIPVDLQKLEHVDYGSARFYTVTYGNSNLVMWQEKESVFAIVGQVKSEDLMAMAAETRIL